MEFSILWFCFRYHYVGVLYQPYIAGNAGKARKANLF